MERIGVGWNEASRFGFEFRNVGWNAKEERNGMKEALLRE
jgi:hypothetical protein